MEYCGHSHTGYGAWTDTSQDNDSLGRGLLVKLKNKMERMNVFYRFFLENRV